MSIVDRILRMPELEAKPPVLVDIGAAKGLHPRWRRIAKYSVCVAFEADEREFQSVTDEAAGFSKLTTYNYIASERSAGSERFHLTASPYCSSRLQPRPETLRWYAFAPLFKVERTVDVRSRDVMSALSELELDRVDWVKIDSQGTDLRLFRSLAELASNSLVVELEPGIIDAYEGEDRLDDVLGEMRERGFWVSDMTVRGSTRVDSELIQGAIGTRASRYLDACHKTAPGWVEIEYFNGFFDDEALGKREFLLGFLFAFLRRQYAFALELAVRGRERFGSPFEELESTALRRVKSRFARLPVSVSVALGRRAIRR